MLTLSRRSWLLDAVALTTLASQPLQAQTSSAANSVADAMLRKDPLPALSVAAFRGSALVFAQAFGQADRVIEATFRTSRHTAVTLEARSLLADFNPAERQLTVWQSTQVP